MKYEPLQFVERNEFRGGKTSSRNDCSGVFSDIFRLVMNVRLSKSGAPAKPTIPLTR